MLFRSTEQAEYEIVAIFKTVAYSSEGFRYYDFVDAENEEEFNSYVGKCKELALYDTGVTGIRRQAHYLFHLRILRTERQARCCGKKGRLI